MIPLFFRRRRARFSSPDGLLQLYIYIYVLACVVRFHICTHIYCKCIYVLRGNRQTHFFFFIIVFYSFNSLVGQLHARQQIRAIFDNNNIILFWTRIILRGLTRNRIQ